MKISLQNSLIAFVLLLCTSAPHVFAASSNDKLAQRSETASTLPLITGNNFISLWWSFDSSSRVSFKIKRNVVDCEHSNKTVLTANLSNNQVNALIKNLNKVRLNAGDKKHTVYPDVVFTLIFSDRNNKDQNENFVFFKDTAESNVDLEEYLRNLVKMKFPD